MNRRYLEHIVDPPYEWINGWMVRPGVIDYYRCERCRELEGETIDFQAAHVRIGKHWQNCAQATTARQDIGMVE